VGLTISSVMFSARSSVATPPSFFFITCSTTMYACMRNVFIAIHQDWQMRNGDGNGRWVDRDSMRLSSLMGQMDDIVIEGEHGALGRYSSEYRSLV
jgi:hypothetical protein